MRKIIACCLPANPPPVGIVVSLFRLDFFFFFNPILWSYLFIVWFVARGRFHLVTAQRKKQTANEKLYNTAVVSTIKFRFNWSNHGYESVDAADVKRWMRTSQCFDAHPTCTYISVRQKCIHSNLILQIENTDEVCKRLVGGKRWWRPLS